MQPQDGNPFHTTPPGEGAPSFGMPAPYGSTPLGATPTGFGPGDAFANLPAPHPAAHPAMQPAPAIPAAFRPAPWWKKILAGFSILTGLFFSIAIFPSLESAPRDIPPLLTFIAFAALPGVWWFRCEGRDKKAWRNYLHELRQNEQLQALLTPADRVITQGMSMIQAPEPINRMWSRINIAEVALLFAFFFLVQWAN